MSQTDYLSTSSVPANYTLLHDILRSHLHRGNHFAVLAALALNLLHEDPTFWRSCDYRDGLAAAVLASSPDGASSPPLSINALYLLLRGAGGSAEEPLLRCTISQLERTNTTGDEAQAARAMRQMDMSSIRAVLAERFRTRHGTTKRPREATPIPMEKAEEEKEEEEAEEEAEEEKEGTPKDAVRVLARLSALPGSTRAVSSFDAVGEIAHTDVHSRPPRPSTNPSSGSGGSPLHQRRPYSHPSHSMAGNGAGQGPVVTVLPAMPIAHSARQHRHRFTPEEDEAILQGVARFAKGPGRFESIRNAFRDVLHPARTSTQLYDHWRGTLRHRVVLQQEGYRGKNTLGRGGGANAEYAYIED